MIKLVRNKLLQLSETMLEYLTCSFYTVYMLIYSTNVCHGVLEWQLTYVPRANYTNPRYGTVSSLASYSDITCALASTTMRWPRLSCFQNGNCLMTMYQTTPRRSSDGIDDPVQCLTNVRENDCDMGNGTAITEETTWDFNCGKLKCSQGQITPTGTFIPPSFAKPTECKSPFTKIPGFGCVAYFADIKTTFCSARQLCFGKGADLINLDSQANKSTLLPFAENQGVNSDFWVGLERSTGNSNWTWNHGGVVTRTDIIWEHSPDTKTSWLCAYSHSTSDGWPLRDDDCTKSYNVACEIFNSM